VNGGAALSAGEQSLGAGFAVNNGGASLNLGNQPGAQQPGAGGPPPENAPAPEETSAAARSEMALPAALSLAYPCGAGTTERCEVSSPDDDSVDARTPEYLRAIAALALQTGVPLATVTACRNGIIEGAMPYDPVRVDAVSAGSLRQLEDGSRVAPLVVRIVYDRQGGYEVREAPIDCYVDANGAVVSLSG
jgi:hypothetical protein